MMIVGILLTCPAIVLVESDTADAYTEIKSSDGTASCDTSAQEMFSDTYLRMTLTDAGFDVSEYSDDEIELLFGWFANKNLVGKYAYDDPTGLNWLLEKAGLDLDIEDVIFDVTEGIIGIIVDGAKITVKGLSLSSIISAIFVVFDIYDLIMENNAWEKAQLAWELMNEGKNYAVYETTVFWNLVANGYEVEEW